MNTITDQELVRKWQQLQQSATSRQISFSLSLKRLKELLTAKKCHFTGITFDSTVESLKRSIDRVESDKGYTDDNTVACIHKFNSIKGCLSYREIMWLVTGLEKHFKKKGVNTKTLRRKKLSYEP